MRIGITGTIGSGKTYVASLLKEMGYKVFDCDKCVSDCYKTDNPCYNQIVSLLGESILDDNNKIDKNLVKNSIKSNHNLKKELENIIHPYVKKQMLTFFEDENKDVMFAEVPLLFEVNWEKYFEKTLLIVADKEITIKRLMENRGMSEEDALYFINNQMNVESKIAKATKVIYNNNTKEDIKNELIKWVKEIER